VRIIATAVVVVGPPEGGRYLRAADDAATPTPILLRPTDHPRVPMALSQFWMAPEKGSVRTAAQANLATAVKFENDGEHTKALTLLNNPATRQDGVLATYADYYRGLALLHLNRTAEARTTFRALQSGTLVGYLAEMAALREAECDVELGDNDAALAATWMSPATRTLAPDDVLMKLGKAAQAAGADDKAQAAFQKVYYDYPLSDFIDEAAAQLDDVPVSGGTLKFQQELARAERLFGATQYPAARASFERLRLAAQGEDRTLVQLRVAEADYYLHKNRPAADALKPFASSGTRTAEALFYYALTQRELKDAGTFAPDAPRHHRVPRHALARRRAQQPRARRRERRRGRAADQESAELFEKFPKGRYTERAAWRIGWHAYRRGDFAECSRIFERAAFNFPRSDYRPAWLYWSGRSHEALNETALAESRYSIEVIDYLNIHGLAYALGGRFRSRDGRAGPRGHAADQ
jgi:TolA-binding protein